MNPLEAEMGKLYDALADGVCVSDAEGRILYMNPAAERLLELPFAKVRDRHFCELLCGRLETPGSAKSAASSCPLRDANRPEQTVSFAGVHNRRTAFEWKADDFKRVEKWRDLKIRCLRTPADFPGARRHITVIEDASAALDPSGPAGKLADADSG